MYEVNCKFQLPEEIIPLDILHRVDHKIPRELNIHILNTGNNPVLFGKITLLGTLTRSTKVESICNIDWSTLKKAKTQAIKQVVNLPETKEFTNKLLPEIPSETNLQLEADMQDRIKTVSPRATQSPTERFIGNKICKCNIPICHRCRQDKTC